MCTYAADLNSINDAYENIRDRIHTTPILESTYLNELSGKELFFKCEFFQKTGSFKARGALNAVSRSYIDKENGFQNIFVTHSSGNHGQALAWAAKCRGATAHIVMPNNSPKCKINAVQEYGGIVTLCIPTQTDRELTARGIVEKTGAKFIHPYDNPDIISGQGTVSLEFLKQVPHLDAIIVPIGGGGLCSGVTIAAKTIKPSIKIIAAEPGRQFSLLARILCIIDLIYPTQMTR